MTGRTAINVGPIHALVSLSPLLSVPRVGGDCSEHRLAGASAMADTTDNSDNRSGGTQTEGVWVAEDVTLGTTVCGSWAKTLSVSALGSTP